MWCIPLFAPGAFVLFGGHSSLQLLWQDVSTRFRMALRGLMLYHACTTWFLRGGDSLVVGGVPRESFVEFAVVSLECASMLRLILVCFECETLVGTSGLAAIACRLFVI